MASWNVERPAESASAAGRNPLRVLNGIGGRHGPRRRNPTRHRGAAQGAAGPLAAWLAEGNQAEWEAEIERDFAPGGPAGSGGLRKPPPEALKERIKIMQLNIPPDLQRLVEKRLASGEYGSAEEVFRRALEVLESEETWTEEKRRALDEKNRPGAGTKVAAGAISMASGSSPETGGHARGASV